MALEQLLSTLTREESLIGTLLELGLRERDALVNSDYAALNDVTAAMIDAADRMDACEAERESLLSELGKKGASLQEIVELAVSHGVEGFSAKGSDLRHQVDALHDIQEQNASLLISAARLRERWLTMLTRLSSASYGPDGTQGGYRLLSRSA